MARDAMHSAAQNPFPILYEAGDVNVFWVVRYLIWYGIVPM